MELRTYEQVEADEMIDLDPAAPVPTVKDMTVIDPYASSIPLDRAVLYAQCCKVYRTDPAPEISEQFNARGPPSAPFEGPRSLEIRNVKLTYSGAMALADCLGLPLTGKHLTEVVLDNCGLTDNTLQLLLSCLYSSSSLERLEVINNPDLTVLSMRRAICYLCLSPQISRFNCSGPQFDTESARLLTAVLSEDKIRAIKELGLEHARLTEEDFAGILPAARNAGVTVYYLRNSGLTARTVELLASMVANPGGLYHVDMSFCKLDQSFNRFMDAFDQRSPLISLELSSCGLTHEQIAVLLAKITILPNFRRLDLSGHDLRPLMPVLRECLPKLHILRRLGLSRTMLESQDIVGLCELLAPAKISELKLTGVVLDSAALSAIYALARVSRTLVNIEIDIPNDAHGEKLSQRILTECIRNMETQEANLDFTETDVHTSMVTQQRKLEENAQPVDRHEELRDGAEGVASALDLHLDSTEEETPRELPMALLERARHIRDSIEPALSEPLSDLQQRRLMLVAETLNKVIARFETTYPDSRRPVVATVAAADVYEHTGKRRPQNIPPRRNNSGLKSRQLEAEEGEIMKLAHKMTDRLQILKSASASASPSRGPSRGELQDIEEAEMLEKMNQADGDILKQRLYELQKDGQYFRPALGQEIA